MNRKAQSSPVVMPSRVLRCDSYCGFQKTSENNLGRKTPDGGSLRSGDYVMNG